MRVTYTHGSSVMSKRCLHMCHVSPRLALSIIVIHQSLLFLDDHFETTPDYDFTGDPIHMILQYFPVLKAEDMRYSSPASRSLATWPNQMQTHAVRETVRVVKESLLHTARCCCRAGSQREVTFQTARPSPSVSPGTELKSTGKVPTRNRPTCFQTTTEEGKGQGGRSRVVLHGEVPDESPPTRCGSATL